MFDWQWGVQGMDFMNTSAAQWEDLATYVLFFCWWSSWWQVRGACPTSYGFMACWAIIQAGWLVRFQYRPRYSGHFSAALSLGSTFDPRIDMTVVVSGPCGEIYIYTYIFQVVWFGTIPKFPQQFQPQDFPWIQWKKTCKKPLFSCTVEFQPGEMSIPSFVRHGLFAARHGEAEQRLGRIPGVFKAFLGLGNWL